MKKLISYALALTVLMMMTAAGGLLAAPTDNGSASAGAPLITMPSFSPVVDKAQAAVVNISTVKVVKGREFGSMGSPFMSPDGGDPFEQFFGPVPRGDRKASSLGSGFIFDPAGYVITNNHVVEGAEDIKVKLTSGEEIHADIIGRDPKTDLALLKLKKEGVYPYLALGNSSELKIGDWVVAIGNPFGLEHTVTAGILSARGRAIGAGPYDDFLQTDASINPGNSGGPLLNLAGEVVGINTAIVAGGSGIGFAIPSNLALGVVDQLKIKGKVVRGWMGVMIQKITPAMAKGLGLKDEKGALVGDVDANGPAAEAGLKSRDVIINFDGKPIDDWQDLPLVVANTEVGKKVKVVVVRDKKEMTVNVKVAELQDDSQVSENTATGKLGLNLQPVSPQLAKRLGLEEAAGVYVASVEQGSLAADAEIRNGDVILEVNDVKIQDMNDYNGAVKNKKSGDTIVFLLYRGGNSFFAAIELP